MHVKTDTIKRLKMKLGGVLACLTLAVFTLLPVTAFAQSATYALACGPNPASVQVSSSGGLSCKGGGSPDEGVSVVATGSDSSKYPTDRAVTVVSVNCGKASINSFKTGSSKFSCSKGKPKVKATKTIPAKAAASDPGASANCSDSGCDLIGLYLNPAINLLSGVFGLIAVISLILGAIQYITSEGDPQKTSKAKNRIANTIFAIFAYAALYGFLQFLIPGGFFQ